MDEEKKNAPVNTYVPEAQQTPANPTGALNEKYQQFVADNAANINQMYDAQKQSQLAGLESAYTQNLSDATAQKEKIDTQYNRMANDLAVQYERNRYNNNMQAAQNGLNVGTGSQMNLALNSQFGRDYGALRGQQANAQVEQDRQISNIEAQYRLAVQQAIADNDLARAAALVDEANNKVNQLTKAYQLQQQDMGNAAALLGSAGDFSGYGSLYGLTDDQVGLLQTQWAAQNPDLAYQSGVIDPEQYHAITGKYPRGYGKGGSNADYLRQQLANKVIEVGKAGGDTAAAIQKYRDVFGEPSPTIIKYWQDAGGET